VKDCFGFELFQALQVGELSLEAHPILVIAHQASHLSLPIYQQVSLHCSEEMKFTRMLRNLHFLRFAQRKP
jgi:hypothetical protein